MVLLEPLLVLGKKKRRDFPRQGQAPMVLGKQTKVSEH